MRAARSALEPMTLRAMIDDEAWPSAQAFTSWAKSTTLSPSILRSTVTVEPHSLESALARGVRLGKPSDPRDRAGEFDDAAIVDVVDHGGTRFDPRSVLISQTNYIGMAPRGESSRPAARARRQRHGR